jgi:aminoglycoside 3-N-acetyltransferase I
MDEATTIQRLGAADLPTMRRVLELFGDAFEDPAHYASNPPGDAYLADLLASPGFVCLAALRHGFVVGAAAAYVLPKFERARSELYLYDLAVHAAHRRQGIATALIGALRRLAGQLGIEGLYVQADAEDEPAIALYTRLARGARVLHFDIDAVEPDGR